MEVMEESVEGGEGFRDKEVRVVTEGGWDMVCVRGEGMGEGMMVVEMGGMDKEGGLSEEEVEEGEEVGGGDLVGGVGDEIKNGVGGLGGGGEVVRKGLGEG